MAARIQIVQGGHAVGNQPDTVIATLLGSCIAVCLHDAQAHVGGMNHFLLGEPENTHRLSPADLQCYGVHAMELLINAMMAVGAKRDRLRAHIYGGANMIAGMSAIGRRNAEFARSFVEMEQIAIGRIDVGGTSARRVEFMPYEGRARSMAAFEPDPIARQRTMAPLPTPMPAGDLELFSPQGR